jgi:hypothetical protein
VFEIGSSLREARMRQGLDFNEMELRTKVRAKYLRSLEEEQFDQLPGHTYIKGFLRTYADSLGMDGQLYVDEYNSRFVAGEEEQPLRTRRVAQSHRRRQRRESRIVLVALTAIAIATALVIAAWKFGGQDAPQVQGVNSSVPRVPATSRSVVSLDVRAVGGASYMEVRVGSRFGKPLYSGTLERGQVKRFQEPRLYLAVASRANVVVRVDGKRVTLPAAGELVVRAQRTAGSS